MSQASYCSLRKTLDAGKTEGKKENGGRELDDRCGHHHLNGSGIEQTLGVQWRTEELSVLQPMRCRVEQDSVTEQMKAEWEVAYYAAGILLHTQNWLIMHPSFNEQVSYENGHLLTTCMIFT